MGWLWGLSNHGQGALSGFSSLFHSPVAMGLLVTLCISLLIVPSVLHAIIFSPEARAIQSEIVNTEIPSNCFTKATDGYYLLCAKGAKCLMQTTINQHKEKNQLTPS